MLSSKFLTAYMALYSIFINILSTFPSEREREIILKTQFVDSNFITRIYEPALFRCKYSLFVTKHLFYN
jgi:hypothetical protein